MERENKKGSIVQTIKPIDINEEMKSSYIDYAMSVIIGRALPDVRDGLKPVHRRILYAMSEQGFVYGRPYKKCARIVGEVLGKYHPHGDTAVYDSLVRMAQDFSLRYPIIDGQGNFGSIDGDSPAAMRYTEARMAKIANEIMQDIEKETVDFMPNFDESLEEPKVLPSKLPNLIINGTSGIAVGLATNIPPHNLREVCDGIIDLIDNPDIEIKELMKHIKGPDFPTGGIICGISGVREASMTGRGKLTIRAVAKVEEIKNKKDRECIIVSEIPFQVNKSDLIVRIAELVQDKKITGIADLRDESDKKGMRIYIELKRGANSQVVLNQLFKHTTMQTTYGVNMVALVENTPKLLNIKEALQHYIKHREVVITRRTQYELKKAQERAHILEGLRIALKNLDAVIKLIKQSNDPETAKKGLVEKFKLTEIQAQAILDMRLQRLTGLEREKIEKEYKGLLEKIEDLKDILSKKTRVFKIIKEEHKELAENYGDERKTTFSKEAKEVEMTDLIAKEQVVVILTNQGFIKRMPVAVFKNQLRGGKGVTGMVVRSEDIIDKMYTTNTHNFLMCFSNKGRAYRLRVYDIPDASRMGKGISISNILKLEIGEEITAAINVENFEAEGYLFMATTNGTVKKTELKEFRNLKNSSMIAIRLDKGDELNWVKLTDGKRDAFMITERGIIIRFNEKEVRPMGRNTRGVRGISLKQGDKVVGMDIIEEGCNLFIITKLGYGKNTRLKEYRPQHRGGHGIIAMKLRAKKGTDKIARAKMVKPDDDILIVTRDGTISRQKVNKISTQKRTAKGVKVQKLDGDDNIVDVAVVINEETNDSKI